MKKFMLMVFFLGSVLVKNMVFAGKVTTVINVPVTTLWECEKQPTASLCAKQPPLMFNDLPDISTQLLFGEQVEVVESQGDWSFVRALEQSSYNHQTGNLECLQGWVSTDHLFTLKNGAGHVVSVTSMWAPVYKSHAQHEKGVVFMHLSMGSVVHVQLSFLSDCYGMFLGGSLKGFIPKCCVSDVFSALEPDSVATIRKSLVSFAQEFVKKKSPYCWGGRCAWNDQNFDDIQNSAGTVTSVDCSGLVNIVYRACGLLIPRNAHDQLLFADVINSDALNQGDLIFLINHKTGRARHVILYAGIINGQEHVIESTGADIVARKGCRCISVHDLFGVSSLQDVKNDDIRFGSILGNYEKASQARSKFLSID
jgi:hypothetical protein